jgi:hypothetical protein
MRRNPVLYEAQNLYCASERLDALAAQYPEVSEALTTISASVRSTATLLEVMDAIKLAQVSGLRTANA